MFYNLKTSKLKLSLLVTCVTSFILYVGVLVHDVYWPADILPVQWDIINTDSLMAPMTDDNFKIVEVTNNKPIVIFALAVTFVISGIGFSSYCLDVEDLVSYVKIYNVFLCFMFLNLDYVFCLLCM